MKKVLFSLLSLSFALQLISQLDAYAKDFKVSPIKHKPKPPIIVPEPPKMPKFPK